MSRSKELQVIDGLLSSLDAGSAGLVIVGEHGIGKSTLWAGGVARARERGFRVLSACADEAESVLAYGVVADLLAEVEAEVLERLPDRERAALDRLLFRAGAEGPAADQRETAAALVSIVTELALTSPVLLAVDDVQWLDASSRAVLEFAAPRLGAHVAVLLTGLARASESEPASWLQLHDPDAVRRVRIDPLSIGALRTMIFDRLGRTFSRPTMVRIAELSAGNPFYALELARSIDGRATSGNAVLPTTLAELVTLRVGHLDGVVADLLLASSCVTNATADLLAGAVGLPAERVMELLESPRREGIVRIDGKRVLFAHPLLARGVYTQAGPARRRRMHRALAAVETQPELKARHLALGAASVEPDTLIALDDAADAAVARGAHAAAADLYELAVGLGGDTPTRRLNAAEQYVKAADNDRARAVLEPAVDGFGPGLLRATARVLLGQICVAEHDYARACALLTAALADAEDDLALLVRAGLLLSRAQTVTGRHRTARYHAERAVSDAERLGDPLLLGQALAARVTLSCSHGLGRDEAALERARELQRPEPDVEAPFRASVADAVTMAWTGRLDEALAGLVAARRRCLEHGSEADLVYVSSHLSTVYVWLGRYSVAAEIAEDMMRRGEQTGVGYPVLVAGSQRAFASAYLGQERAVRKEVRVAIEGARGSGSPFLAVWPLMTLGFLEVSLGNFAEAVEVLQPLLPRAQGAPSTEIIAAAYQPDVIEAMVAIGRFDDATPLIDVLQRNGARLDRPWMLAVGARCRSMVAAARGDLAGAEEAMHEALTHHDRLPMPFERARTLLLHGQVLRRQRHKQLAVSAVGEALGVFEDLGARLWADRARTELVRMDAPRTADSILTPAELRVARLTASGMTNKDIAAALFISPKTVEHNLSRVYQKLEVRTRAELAGMLDPLAAK